MNSLARSFDDSWDGDTLASARRQLRSFHEDSILWPLLWFLALTAVHVLATVAALSTVPLVVRGGAALLAGLTGARLFLIGHDAAHGSYTPSKRLNAAIGRISLLASFHAYSLWQSQHMEHHRYTNLRGRDFVWTPLSVREFARLGPVRRALQRLYRNDVGLGLGVYYMMEIWLPRMLFPRKRNLENGRSDPRIDTALIAAYGIALAVAAVWFAQSGGRVGQVDHWVSVLFLGILIPLAIVQWLIGFVVYFNHTHPTIPWFRDHDEWSYWNAQIACSAHQEFEYPRHFFVPSTIMNHTAHHFDMRIPLRKLELAQKRLEALLGAPIPTYKWTWHEFRDTLRRCKLYDYEAHRWLDFAGKPTTERVDVS